jgi:hypothetical protein
MGLLSQKSLRVLSGTRSLLGASRASAAHARVLEQGDEIGAHYITSIVPVNGGYERTAKRPEALPVNGFERFLACTDLVRRYRDLPEVGRPSPPAALWTGLSVLTIDRFSTTSNVRQGLFVERDPI